ncbi:MAG: hypothetical protein WCW52_07790 [Elusimicrobiales bacterium]|jgi:His-Xaa-Ser system protein HxsD
MNLKKQGNNTVSVDLGFKEHSPDTIRYAAYAVSGEAYVFIKPEAGGTAVEFTPKSGNRGTESGTAKALLKRFQEELEDEKLRAAISDANLPLREFMILKALSYTAPPGGVRRDDSGLTPEQEKELNALIAQVEREIRKESAGRRTKDPLGLTRTWEEKYGAKTGRKKN